MATTTHTVGRPADTPTETVTLPRVLHISDPEARYCWSFIYFHHSVEDRNSALQVERGWKPDAPDIVGGTDRHPGPGVHVVDHYGKLLLAYIWTPPSRHWLAFGPNGETVRHEGAHPKGLIVDLADRAAVLYAEQQYAARAANL